MELSVIAHIRSDFPAKFGIPRQSGLTQGLKAQIIFTPPYRNPDAVRGIESYSHLWLLWEFSEVKQKTWSPTVRPPRLGGNKRVGVFATRSPYRPNPVGLSSVRLERVVQSEKYGPILEISGADLMDNTPIFDIKPYLPYTDAHPDAADGISTPFGMHRLAVEFPQNLLEFIPSDRREGLLEALAEDPRPAYQPEGERVYGMLYAGYNIRFRVESGTLTVIEVTPA